MNLPIACSYMSELGLFQVTRCKGKTLASGGFGIVLSNPHSNQATTIPIESLDESNPFEEAKLVDHATSNNNQTVSLEYLFVEEVLFLFERGLLQAVDREGNPLESPRLYALLDNCDLSLAIYLVYAHLRKQDYRVVRHTPTRRRILSELGQCQAADYDTKKTLKRQLRQDAASAKPPTLNGIAFDVYHPRATFARSDPGLPDFIVAAVVFEQTTQFGFLRDLLQTSGDVAVKVATVSESGTVIMFGLSNMGVPILDSLA